METKYMHYEMEEQYREQGKQYCGDKWVILGRKGTAILESNAGEIRKQYTEEEMQY